MNITIGTTNDDPRKLEKTMSGGRTIPVQIWKNCDVKKPAFLLDVRADDIHANYCYVPAWGSYYYLSEPVIMDGNRCTVTGTLDPLGTYAAEIRQLTGYLVRTADENYKNEFLHDNMPAQSNRQCMTYQFNRSPFTANFATDIVYILTVIGGRHT